MRITIRPNEQLEGYDLIDVASNQSHDGDNAGEWIATVYDKRNAENIAALLNVITGTPQNGTQVTDDGESSVNAVLRGLARAMQNQIP